MDAREVAVIITGAHKALALAKCIEEGNRMNHINLIFKKKIQILI
jgi:hypothetical protein